MDATGILEVDALAYPVHFQGFHAPLHVWPRGGAPVALRPWTCGEHLAALGRHLKPGAGGAVLDVEAFCAEVLAREGLGGEVARELAPLALWWAAGGGAPPVRPGPDGELVLESCRLRLRTWTYGERLRALAGSVRVADGGRRFDVGRYLGAMLDACVTEVSSVPGGLRALDSASTVGLLDAVVALNSAEEAEEALGSAEVAAVTLRLCRALGWTPSQVWATPAPEVDRLVRLLEALRGAAPARPVAAAASRSAAPLGGSRLADHPDAIVIQIEDGAV